ncbi:hypothetical protein [Paenibacillus naphthalenovorans]|uniref:hypothetical protein n=1 Tax=Paenibacillus naphthalenovorans TaxID=162209 RepID=UPI003D2B302E
MYNKIELTNLWAGTITMDRKELEIEDIVEQLGISLGMFKEWNKESINNEPESLFINAS